MKQLLLLIIVLLFFLSGPVRNATAQSLPSSVKESLNSIVTVETEDLKGNTVSRGLGFFVSPNQVLTNLSNLKYFAQSENNGQLYVSIVGKRTRHAVNGISVLGKTHKLAILNVTIPRIKPLPINNTDQHSGTVYAISSTSISKVAKGIVKGNSKNRDYIRISNPISNKNTGGPILNSKGEVIGIGILISELSNGFIYDDESISINIGKNGGLTINAVGGKNAIIIKKDNTDINIADSAFAVSSNVIKNLLTKRISDSTNSQRLQDIINPRNPDSNRIVKTFDVNPGGRLTLAIDSGEIVVKTGIQDKIDVRITKEAKVSLEKYQIILNDFKVTFDHKGSNLNIIGRFQRGRNYWQRELNNVKIHFEVTVPKKYGVDLNTPIDDISVDGVAGELQAKTSTGDIGVINVIGPTQVHTSTGDLRIERIKGSISGRSSTGDITMSNCQGSIVANTSTGDIHVHMPTQLRHAWNLQTSTGDIVLTLLSNLTANIDVQTSVGDISSDFRVLTTLNRKKRVRGTINGGGQLLRLQTSTGDIRLRSR